MTTKQIFFHPSPEMRGPFELKGFSRLRRIEGTLLIDCYSGLRETEAFDQLERVGGNVEISGTFLEEIPTFDHPLTIDKDLIISNNNKLEALFDPTDPIDIGGDIYIVRNEILPTCDARAFAESYRKNGFTKGITVCENLKDSCEMDPCPDPALPSRLSIAFPYYTNSSLEH